jgi:adenosylcobinamide kinase / adenosylcobinamide-phosphate guanylyltransferase
LILKKRKSGDRPDTNLGDSTSLGELKSIDSSHPARTSEQVMGTNSLSSVTLVLGGVRSGKSSYALKLANSASQVTFLATAELRDDEEMRRKIERHRTERPAHWKTIEEPLDLAAAVEAADCDLLLIDCLTLYAGKLLDTYGDDSAKIDDNIAGVCRALKNPPCSVVLVSNEVGSGVVPSSAMGRRYRDLLGEINQQIATIAGCVVLMIAGLPLALKGSLA